ncbi:pyridoxal phosphate-dependent decarboxylase family protein [Pseudaeromonas paramecii]|uniref:Decarboxylase n=1 Tax=Pseudaeromonas paramecii TaxID=2138166 RepID=A0ABP8Q1R9_9GAMM
MTRHLRRHTLFTDQMKAFLTRQSPEARLTLSGAGTNSLAAWFLGPKAENKALFTRLIQSAIEANCAVRETLFDDPAYVTAARKDQDYDLAVDRMECEFNKLLAALGSSVPFFSYRYQAHMNWDLTMPGLLGYFAAMLYNQNNVALEASPVTAQLEHEVGQDLCRMLGFDTDEQNPVPPWGHITCDGSVANLEAMWAARNLKYYPLSLKMALQAEPLLQPHAQDIRVTLCDGSVGILVEQDAWTLFNLHQDEVLSLPEQIASACGITSSQLTQLLDPYLLQSTGIQERVLRLTEGTAVPVVMGPATKHYSWPKNAAILGIGKSQFVNIPVDEMARMTVRSGRGASLEAELEACLQQKQPVLMVVVVLGSTEESAVDPLAEVIQLREQFRQRGLEFVIHVDGAWGGYFASLLRGSVERLPTPAGDVAEQVTPVLAMSEYVTAQYQAIAQADSVTIDPHKAGYIPYPAGGLCYRNGAMRNLVAFLAPEVYHSDGLDANMGVYGVEGSKPGAAPTAVYLSHRIIRPDRSGYGKILGQALFNSKRFYSAIITMAEAWDDFVVVPVQQIPAERAGLSPEQIAAQMDFIKTRIVPVQNNALIQDAEAMALLKELGSDQIIITYGLNFKCQGRLNPSADLANQFMQDVFLRLSVRPSQTSADKMDIPNLIITTSDFTPDEYGDDFVATYMRRLGVEVPAAELPTMHFLSSTTMCPWLTATAEGNFIPELIAAFRTAVAAVLPAYQ